MISRTLVPRDVKPITAEEFKKRAANRITTYMDDRTVVPAGPSDAPPLNGKTSIPAHMPLGVLVDTILVPRGMPIKPIERSQATQEAGAMALEVLDARMVVPAHVKPMAPEQREELERPMAVTAQLRDVVEPDIFLTGDANLLMEPEEKHDSKWDNLARMGSIAAHIVLILFLINVPRIFRESAPTQADLQRAQDEFKNLVYLPPERPTPPPPTPKLPRIDPNLLKKMAPPPVERPAIPEPTPPAPQPKPQPELPEAPTPHVVTPTQPPTQPPPQVAQNTPPPPKPSELQPVKPQPNHLNLEIPDASPGQLLKQQEADAMKRAGNQGSYSTQGQIPTGPGSARPTTGNAVQILSPTMGVDFNPYIQRMLDTIRRNWYAIMPQSALLGDKGMVYITFQINPDGSVQPPDPQMERTSEKPPLDNAAISSIRASNPFEPLPKEFKGPYMRFGIFFLYNLPLDYVNQH